MNFELTNNPHTYLCIENPLLKVVLHPFLYIEPFIDYRSYLDFNEPDFVDTHVYLNFQSPALLYADNNFVSIFTGFTDLRRNYNSDASIISAFFSNFPLLPLFYEFYNSSSTFGEITFSLKNSLPSSFDLDDKLLPYSDLYFSSDDDFQTNLYPDLLNNYEQASMAQSFLNDTDPQKELDPDYWTDKYLAFCKFVEEYNKNVLLLRSTRKVDASVSGSISQSGQQQQIDLSSLNANTARIANNLQMLDFNQNVKSITKVIDDKNNDQQVVVTTVEKAPYNPFLVDDEF